jgi:hypothetical protein
MNRALKQVRRRSTDRRGRQIESYDNNAKTYGGGEDLQAFMDRIDDLLA